jgi:hypothetical protein
MRHLKYCILAVMLICCLSMPGRAEQDTPQSERAIHSGQGYIFFAPGTLVGSGHSIRLTHFGGGGEAIFYKGAGIGIEAGFVAPWRNFCAGLGILSLNGSYHFSRSKRLSPFVTGGYSLGVRNGYINLVNFGGGANYWFRDRLGLRLEFRDHVDRAHNQYVSGRIGLSFR